MENVSNIEEKNSYVIVYSALVYSKENAFKQSVVYFPIKYNGLYRIKDSEYSVYENNGIIGETRLLDSYYTTKGYIDGSEMYKMIITSNRDKYNYEVSQGLQKFGK